MTMGLLDVFKSKKRREENARVRDVLGRADERIDRIERELEKMKRDDEAWKRIVGY